MMNAISFEVWRLIRRNSKTWFYLFNFLTELVNNIFSSLFNLNSEASVIKKKYF